MRRKGRHLVCSNTDALRALELDGALLRVENTDEGLLLSGDEGGAITIRPEEVTRLRYFRMEAVHSLYAPTNEIHETKIWWRGHRRPVLIVTSGEPDCHRDVIGRFAAKAAELHGLDILRLGPGYTTGIINLLIVAPPTLLLFALVLFIAVADGGWWWVAALSIFMLFTWLAGRNIVSRWPRRVRSMEKFYAEFG